MKRKKSIFHKLSVQIVIGILFFITVLTILIILIGYSVFMKSIYAENVNSARITADYAGSNSHPWDFQAYVDIGLDRMWNMEWLYDGEELKEGMEREQGLISDFFVMMYALDGVVSADEENTVALILGVPDRDYRGYRVVYSYEKKLRSENGLFADQKKLGDHVDEVPQQLSDSIQQVYGQSVDDTEDKVIYLTVDGEYCVGVVRSVWEGDQCFGFLALFRSLKDVISTGTKYVIGITASALSIMVVIAVLLILFLKVRVVRPVKVMSEEAERFAEENKKGETELVNRVGNSAEIIQLAEALDKMEEDTERNMHEITRMSRESERIETELALAAQIQRSVLPGEDPNLANRPEFSVHATMDMAREVGGDFYDYFLVDQTHLAFLIADVSDKGMGAAFFMAMSRTYIKTRADLGGSTAEILSYVMNKLSEKNETGMFVTVWMGIIDLETGEIDAGNAGHEYPATLRAGQGYVIEKTIHSPPLCFLPGIKQSSYQMKIGPGDRIFLYTDGIKDARNKEGERYGEARLLEVLNRNRNATDEEIIRMVKADVDAFAGDAEQYDDMTMLSFTFHGPKAADV